MASILPGLADTETVRAVLGAHSVEISDEVLISLDLDLELIVDFGSWLPSDTSYETIVQSGQADGATDDEIMAYRMLRLYSKYQCAWLVAHSQALMLAEVINDGQSEMRRPKREETEKLLKSLRGMADRFKNLLLPLLGGTANDGATLFSKASPDYDPVTNETA